MVVQSPKQMVRLQHLWFQLIQSPDANLTVWFNLTESEQFYCK